MAIDINSLIKQYANPWDTSYNYLDPTGAILGKGYDSYEDAIRKLAFTSGLQTHAAQAAVAPSGDYFFNGDPGQGQPWNPGGAATPEQYSWNQYQDHPEFRFEGIGVDPGQDTNFVAPSGTSRFNTKQELYDYLMGQPGDALTYESKEKYGRALTEGQLQNMYARYASGNLVGAVPDWTYHREAYNTQNTPGIFTEAPKSGYRIAGEQALVGSTPVFGYDGKIVGYKINLSPDHVNLADTSGRVQSSTNGATLFDTSLKDFAVPMGDGTAFVKAEDISKLAYSSTGNSTYSKDPNFFDKYMPGLIQSAAIGGTLAGLGGAFGGTATGSTGGTGMFDWLNDAGSWISDLFGGGGGSGATEFASSIASAADPIEAMYQTMAATGTTSVTDAAAALGFNSANAMLGAINPSWLSAGSSFLTDAAKQAASKLASGGGSTGLLSGGLQAIGGYLSGNAATDAAKTSAQAQLEAARIAADAAKFKPVGVTTRFGQSQFTKDAQGNVTNAGYTMPADIRAMQDSLLGAAPGMLSQFTGSQAATAPMGTAAQRMMTLGNQYLAADPQAQAKLFYDQQQAIMATERARQEAGTLAGEFNRGTYGLATGGTGMMGAANPRMEAMYNAQRQQDLQAAYDATKGGQQYATFGSGMVGAGGDMLKSMYGTQAASLDPWKTAMGGAQTIEGLGQNALDLSVNMGKVASPAQSGQLLGQGMLGAAQTMQQANQYSPWGTALMNAGNTLNTMNQPQNQNPTYDPSRFRLVPFGN